MPAPEFVVNTTRYDPYKNFRFRVKWDGKYVAGVSKVSALSRTTQVVTHRSGGDPSTPRVSPGQTQYGPITLEKGVTYDPAFELWANKIWDYTNSLSDSELTPVANPQFVSLADFRKSITIELYNEAGQKALAWNVYRCWVSEYQALPELDGGANAVAIQMIKIENEGWERDPSVTEQKETSFPQSGS